MSTIFLCLLCGNKTLCIESNRNVCRLLTVFWIRNRWFRVPQCLEKRIHIQVYLSNKLPVVVGDVSKFYEINIYRCSAYWTIFKKYHGNFCLRELKWFWLLISNIILFTINITFMHIWKQHQRSIRSFYRVWCFWKAYKCNNNHIFSQVQNSNVRSIWLLSSRNCGACQSSFSYY